MRNRWWQGFCGLVVAAAASGPALAQDNVAKVGDHPTYSWQAPMTNGQGVKSLADLKGRPVVVEFWGTT